MLTKGSQKTHGDSVQHYGRDLGWAVLNVPETCQPAFALAIAGGARSRSEALTAPQVVGLINSGPVISWGSGDERMAGWSSQYLQVREVSKTSSRRAPR